MRRAQTSRSLLVALGAILVTTLLLAPGAVCLFAQSPELIVDILTTPNRYWNKVVVIKGHVRSVASNPPGTNRGSYVLRDASDSDLTVLSDALPAPGKEYTVTGTVEQVTPDDTVPCLREMSRRLGIEAMPAPTRPQAQPAPAPTPPVATTPAPSPIATPPPVQAAAPEPAPVAAAPAGAATPVPAPAAASNNVLVYALVGVVAIFSLVLVVLFWPRRMPAVPRGPAQLGASKPPPPPMIPAAARPAQAQAAGAAADPVGATRLVGAGRSGAAAGADPKATELFMDLGAELVVTDGPDRGRHFPLTKPRVAIGRSGGRHNDVLLSDDTVSREHARIVYNPADKTFRLVNESNTNPVRVNGAAIESVLVQDNDNIQLGATSLRFKKLWSAAGSAS
jgi:hypothetical protein